MPTPETTSADILQLAIYVTFAIGSSRILWMVCDENLVILGIRTRRRPTAGCLHPPAYLQRNARGIPSEPFLRLRTDREGNNAGAARTQRRPLRQTEATPPARTR